MERKKRMTGGESDMMFYQGTWLIGTRSWRWQMMRWVDELGIWRGYRGGI